MINEKGQALIEFILLLPIIIILIFTTLDVLNLILKKNDLSTRLNDEIILVENKKETLTDLEVKLESEDINITFKEEDKYITINASKKVKWISPITTAILKEYNLKIKRVIPLE